jgi:hypothetical protein
MKELFQQKSFRLALLLLWFGFSLQAQFDDPCKYIPTTIEKKIETADLKDTLSKKQWSFSQKHQFDFAFNAHTRDQSTRAVCKLNASSRLAFELKYQRSKIAFETSITDETSAIVFFDSTLEKKNDLLRIKISAENNSSKKIVKKSASALLSTQKFNSVKVDSKVINSAFLSPAEVIFAMGMNIKLKSSGKIECGIGSLKLTWIDKKALYELHKTQELHGVPRNKTHKLEGGISFQTQWQRLISKNITWENKSLIFSSFNEPGVPNLELRNDFLLKSGKSIQTTVRSIYTYNKNKWPPASFGGEIALGVMLNKN